MTFLRNHSYSLLALVLCVIIGFSSLIKLSTEQTYMEITIAEGDTLWELAANYAEGSQSTNKWISEVRKLNNLSTTTIKAGESLRLPVKAPLDEWKTSIELADRTQ